jgi:hypothetical protein
LKTGQAVVIGSLDGGRSNPGTYYLEVPKPKEAAATASAPQPAIPVQPRRPTTDIRSA